jgi:hypothetical protein
VCMASKPLVEIFNKLENCHLTFFWVDKGKNLHLMNHHYFSSRVRKSETFIFRDQITTRSKKRKIPNYRSLSSCTQSDPRTTKSDLQLLNFDKQTKMN